MFSYGIPIESKQGSFSTYSGKYPAQIIDINDPENRGRVRVVCPHVFDQGESYWAEGCFPPGSFYVPPAGSFVWVEFFQGNPEYPIWVGQFYPIGKAPDPETDLETKAAAMIGDEVTVNISLSGTDSQGDSITLSGTAKGTITKATSKIIITG
jgi:hypothetical protein